MYSAGWAHRDWPTLLEALAQVRCAAVLSVPEDVRATPVREGITMLTQVSPAEGRELMVRADVFALSAVDTDLPSGPLVLLDAMALGKAIVATDVNGTRDYLSDERTGLLVPPGDVAALARALERALTNRDLRDELGRGARAWAESYSVADMVGAILDEVRTARAGLR